MAKAAKKRANWDIWLQEAEKYREEHGDLNVPFGYKTESGMLLGRWLQRQRNAYEGKEGLMTLDRIQDLEKLGIVWQRGHHTSWDDMYEEAKTYFEHHGNLRIPHNYETPSGKKLGLWIKHQRDKYSGAVASSLDEEKIEKLNALGMQWRIYGPTSTWDDWYKEAAAFYKKYGHLNVHTQYVTPSGRRLGLWIKSQRYKGRENLPPEQAEKLDRLHMEWSVKVRTDWDIWYAMAREYWEEHGSLPESKDYITPDGKKLGVWISVQRERYTGRNKKPLTQDQIALLEELGMVWRLGENHWNEMYDLAKAYEASHGNLLVPQSYVTENGKKLGRWISIQRQAYFGKGTSVLSPERIRLLEEIHMCWAPFASSWNTMYETAKQYWQENGNLHVPQGYVAANGQKLGNWISNQRLRKRDSSRNSLSPQQIQLLDEIGMIWDPSALREKEWEYMYNLVKEYWLSHGVYPIDPALKAENGKSLRGWYYQQRREMQKASSSISPKRKKLLEKIGIR